MKHKQTRAKYSALLPKASDRQHWEDVPMYSHDTELSPPQVLSPTKASFPLKEFSAWHFCVPHRPWARTWHSRTTALHLLSGTPNTWECWYLVHLLNHDPLCERAVEPPCKHWSESFSDYFNSSHWLRSNRLRSDFEESFLKSTHYFILETLSIIHPICSYTEQT